MVSKKYLNISEVSRLTGVKHHVLRFWEKKYKQLKPLKIRNRRYYSENDLKVIDQIRIEQMGKLKMKEKIDFLIDKLQNIKLRLFVN